MPSNTAPQGIVEQEAAISPSYDELTRRVMGELRDILDKSASAGETGSPNGAILYYSIQGPGIRYYGFEAPERVGRDANVS